MYCALRVCVCEMSLLENGPRSKNLEHFHSLLLYGGDICVENRCFSTFMNVAYWNIGLFDAAAVML